MLPRCWNTLKIIRLSGSAPVLRMCSQFKTDLSRLDTYLQFYISQEVRKRLPQLLQQRGETTFSQQIRTLAEALQGEQGQRFAVYVQARYP